MNVQFSILNPYTGMYFAEDQSWVSSPVDGMSFGNEGLAWFMIMLCHLDAVVELTAVIE